MIYEESNISEGRKVLRENKVWLLEAKDEVALLGPELAWEETLWPGEEVK